MRGGDLWWACWLGRLVRAVLVGAALVACVSVVLSFGAGARATAQVSGVADATAFARFQIVHESDPVDLAEVRVGDTVRYEVSYTNTGNVPLNVVASYFFSAPGPDPDPLMIDPSSDNVLTMSGGSPTWVAAINSGFSPGRTATASYTYLVRDSDFVPSADGTPIFITSSPGAAANAVGRQGHLSVEVVCGSGDTEPATPAPQGFFTCSDGLLDRSVGDQRIDLTVAERATMTFENDSNVTWETDGSGISVSADIVDPSGAVLTGQVVAIDEWLSSGNVPRLDPIFCRVTFLWDGEDPDGYGPPTIDSIVDTDDVLTFPFLRASLALEKDVPVSVWSSGVRLQHQDRNTGATCAPAGTYVDGGGGGATPVPLLVSVAAEDRELQIIHTSDPVDLAAVGVGDTITYTVSYTNTGNAPIEFVPSYYFRAPGGNPDLLRATGWQYVREDGWGDDVAAWWEGPRVLIAEPGSTESYLFTYVVREADFAGEAAESATISSYPGATFFDGIQTYCGSRSVDPGRAIAAATVGNYWGPMRCSDVEYSDSDLELGLELLGDQQIDHQLDVARSTGRSGTPVAGSGCAIPTTTWQPVPDTTWQQVTTAPVSGAPATTSATGSAGLDEAAQTVARCGPCAPATLTFSGCWEDVTDPRAPYGVSTTTTTSYLGGNAGTVATAQATVTTVPIVSGDRLPITGGQSQFLVGLAVLNFGVGLILVSVGAVHLGRKLGYFEF